MEDFKILSTEMYEDIKKGASVMSGNMVEVIGEQTIKFDDGTVRELFLYNIVGYKAKNGKPFAALKDNIVIM